MMRSPTVMNLALVVPFVACGDVASQEDARRAYLGLDASIEKAIALAFQAFNSATSANIAPQTTISDAGGTLTIAGQVDQGASDNKEMRLLQTLLAYSDDGALIYSTSTSAPAQLDLSLKKIPTGTLSGTLVGTYRMRGDLAGEVSLDLAISATLEPLPGDATQVQRRAGTTRVTGTATSPAGVYFVDVTR